MVGLLCESGKGTHLLNEPYVQVQLNLTNEYGSTLAETTILMCLACARKMLDIPDEWGQLFRVGDQIAYMPDHAHGKINHPDVQYGFVTQVCEDFARCRYWSPEDPNRLRTTANSESTYFRNLIHYEYVDQTKVDLLLVELGYVDPFEIDING